MDLEFSAEVWYWRGPSPVHFVTVPDELSAQIESASALVTYGWGMIPAEVQIGSTSWTTSLYPKEGHYIVPFKQAARAAEHVELGDVVVVRLTIVL